MSPSQLMAILTQVGDAGVALAEVLISILLHLYWRAVVENQCPSFCPSICTTVSRPLVPSGSTGGHAIAFSERLARWAASRIRSPVDSPLDKGQGAASAWWTPEAAKQLLEL